jgi:hypothetical protein
MPDLTAMELEERDLTAALPASQPAGVRAFVAGALFSTALAVLGTVLVPVALTVVVVGAPVVAAVIAYALVPHAKSSPAE